MTTTTQRLLLALPCLALALSSCGGSDDNSATKPTATASPTATRTAPPANEAQPCANTVAAGKPVLQSTIDNGCLNGDTIVTFVSFDCKDGSTFAASDDFMGRTGGKWQAGGAGSNSDQNAYSAAVAACQG